MKVYGIKNCNSVKKSLEFLDSKGINYEFIDVKKNAPEKSIVENWVNSKGADIVINKKGMMWRKLPANTREKDLTKNEAVRLALETPTMVKRPVVESDGEIFIGFDEISKKFV